MKRKILPSVFFARDARVVARELLGKYLVRRMNGKIERYRIVETEAYIGPHDKACHAYKGRTKRTEVMFGPAGRWYIYFVYGMHEMLNIVTGPEGYPAAVLIRGVEALPTPHSKSHSSVLQNTRIDGPGRVTKKLGITRALNGKPASRVSGLWIEEGSERLPARAVKRTPRIGVAYAGEWAAKLYRYILEPKRKTSR